VGEFVSELQTSEIPEAIMKHTVYWRNLRDIREKNFERPRRIWEDVIKTDLERRRREAVDWIHLIQETGGSLS
jgi:hypothetical protein